MRLGQWEALGAVRGVRPRDATHVTRLSSVPERVNCIVYRYAVHERVPFRIVISISYSVLYRISRFVEAAERGADARGTGARERAAAGLARRSTGGAARSLYSRLQ